MNPTVFDRSFEELEAGARFDTPARTITETDLVSFSALTGDWHPQHADAVWAAKSVFGERIAHGMLVLSYAVGLLPMEPERVIALRAIRDAVFKRPVPIGATIRVTGEVAGLRPLDEQTGMVTLALQIRDDDGKLMVRFTIDALWRRGAGGEAGRLAALDGEVTRLGERAPLGNGGPES